MTADYCLLKNENKTVLSWKLVVDGGGWGMGQKEWGLDKFGVACAGDIIDCAVSHTIRPLLDQYPPHNLPIKRQWRNPVRKQTSQPMLSFDWLIINCRSIVQRPYSGIQRISRDRSS